jgi:hypothetical protein
MHCPTNSKRSMNPLSSRTKALTLAVYDGEEDILRYVDIKAGGSSSSVEATYLARVGMEFVDMDDDITYAIDSVCREDNPRNRKSFAKLFFKYHDVQLPDEFEYTPCLEVLNSNWCRRKPTASSSAREQRAANRKAAIPYIDDD